MHGSYDPVLVTVSVALAIFASFTALSLAGRIGLSEGQGRRWWLLAAALALGIGIWSMHFVGMLALQMPVAVTYNVDLSLISLVMPVLAVAAGLAIVTRLGPTLRPLAAAGALTGLGIVAMHYIGMEAMRMPGMATTYDPWLVALSVAIAVAAATAALWLTFRSLASWTRLGAAVAMGIAISGMHYTGMAAATFVHVEGQKASLGPSLDTGFLALAVVAATSLLLVIGLLGAFFDRKLAALTAHEAATLRRSEERYRALVEHSSDIVLIADRECRIVYESPSAHPILGYGPGALVGRRLGELVGGDGFGALDSFLTSLQRAPGKIDATELRLRHFDGAWFDFEVVGNNLLEEPAVAGIVLTLRDVTERKRLLHALEKLSETDLLTNTLNRRGFMRLGEREIERVRRYGGALAVVMIDVDHFKAVNDTYGHAAGDLVLAKVADVCRGEIREADVLCRYGGEEFVILLMEADLQTASLVVERLRLAVEAARVHSIKGDVRVTASFGVAIVDPTTCELEGALRLADEALYDAKSSGRNCMKSRASVVNG